MDKELQDIKNAMDCITNNMYSITQIGSAAEGIREELRKVNEALEKVGQIGTPHHEWTGTHATLGDIKEAIDRLSGVSPSSGVGAVPDNTLELQNVRAAIDANTQAMERLVRATETIAEIQLQQLSLKEKAIAEFDTLPWSGEKEANLQYGWAEDLEQSEEKNMEDSSF